MVFTAIRRGNRTKEMQEYAKYIAQRMLSAFCGVSAKKNFC